MDKNADGTPIYYQADPRTDGDPTFNLDDNELTSTDQQKVLDKVGTLTTTDIRVFIIANAGTFLVQNQGLAYGFTNRSAKTCWILGKSTGDYNSQEHLKSTIAHEIGHVLTGYGHPDSSSQRNSAPLDGTDRSLRMMCSRPNRSQQDGRLLVKKEWDVAEIWMNVNIKDSN